MSIYLVKLDVISHNYTSLWLAQVQWLDGLQQKKRKEKKRLCQMHGGESS